MQPFKMGVQNTVYGYIENYLIKQNDERIIAVVSQDDIGIEDILFRLKDTYNVLFFEQLLLNTVSKEKSKPKLIFKILLQVIKPIVALLGPINPTIATLSFGDMVAILAKEIPTVIAGNLNIEKDVAPLLKHFNVKTKQQKKYKKLRTFLYVDHLNSLTDNEKTRLHMLLYLIKYRCIINTGVILKCTSLTDVSNDIMPIPSERFAVSNKDLSQKLGKSIELDDANLELVRHMGIGFLVEFEHIILATNGLHSNSLDSNIEILIDKLVTLEINDVDKDDFQKLLRICSLLIDNFTKFDVEATAKFSDKALEYFLKAIKSKIIVSNEKSYKFIASFIKAFYFRQAAISINTETIREIYSYISRTYPHSYTYLAEISSLISDKEKEVSAYVIAFYYNKIAGLTYLQKAVIEKFENWKITKDFLDILDIFASGYCDSNLLVMANSYCHAIEEYNLSTHARLCIFSLLLPVFTELETEPKKLNSIYSKMNGMMLKLKQDECINIDFWKIEFQKNLIVLSTILDDERSSHIRNSQKQIENVLNYFRNSNSTNSDIHYLKLLSLGNALYPEDFTKGLSFTKEAYEKSENYIILHEVSRINYSTSLLQTDQYSEALRVLKSKDQNVDLEHINSDTLMSYTNNYLVSGYLTESFSAKDVHNKFRELNSKFVNRQSSDYAIIKNNLAAFALIVKNYDEANLILQELIDSQDLYHRFYAQHNGIILRANGGDILGCEKIISDIKLPGLLKTYESFFKKKFEFIIQALTNNNDLKDYVESHMNRIFPDKKYGLYKKLILLGTMERWYE